MKIYTVAQIAQAVHGRVQGDATREIRGVGALETAGAADLTWLAQERLRKSLATTGAGVVLTTPLWAADVPAGSAAIVVERPAIAIITVLGMFEPKLAIQSGMHPSAVVDPTATIGADVSVGPHVTIGPEAVVGDRTVLHAGVYVGEDVRVGCDCVLWPNVVIRERCILGNQVVIHANATIGSDGFGYEFMDGKHLKVPQIGNVVIADDVEIGANTCVDRAKFGSTTIGQGAKIDNLTQIAHNVEVGPGVIMAAQVGIAGSVTIGAFSMFGGKSGSIDHCRIGNQALVASGCIVASEVPDKGQVAGIMAYDIKSWRRGQIAMRRLPEMLEQVRQLAQRVQKLESADNHPEGS